MLRDLIEIIIEIMIEKFPASELASVHATIQTNTCHNNPVWYSTLYKLKKLAMTCMNNYPIYTVDL